MAIDINMIVNTSETNGPAVVSDASLMLMSKLLHVLNHQMPNSSYNTCTRIVRWAFLRWDPGKSHKKYGSHRYSQANRWTS